MKPSKFSYVDDPALVAKNEIPSDLKEVSTEKVFNTRNEAGEILTLHSATVGKTYYAAKWYWWAMGEDGDYGEDNFLLQDAASARRVVNEHATFMNRKTTPMLSSDATRFEVNGKRVTGLLRGKYLVTFSPAETVLFDGVALKQDGLYAGLNDWLEIKDRGYTVGQKKLAEVVASDHEPYLLRVGKNKSGRIVKLLDAYGNPIEGTEPQKFSRWEATKLGMQLVSRLPADVFNRIRPTLRYVKAHEAQDYIDDTAPHFSYAAGRFQGWYAGPGTAAALEKNGFQHNL